MDRGQIRYTMRSEVSISCANGVVDLIACNLWVVSAEPSWLRRFQTVALALPCVHISCSFFISCSLSFSTPSSILVVSYHPKSWISFWKKSIGTFQRIQLKKSQHRCSMTKNHKKTIRCSQGFIQTTYVRFVGNEKCHSETVLFCPPRYKSKRCRLLVAEDS